MVFFESLSYLGAGIALTLSPQTAIGIDPTKMKITPIANIEQAYTLHYNPSTSSVYSVKDFFVFPKRNYMQRYKAIAESSWFQKSYEGKSLGDYIEVDY